MFECNREETNLNLGKLQNKIKANAQKFDNDHRNLRSYITDMQELSDLKTAKKSYALEQIPKQAVLAK